MNLPERILNCLFISIGPIPVNPGHQIKIYPDILLLNQGVEWVYFATRETYNKEGWNSFESPERAEIYCDVESRQKHQNKQIHFDELYF